MESQLLITFTTGKKLDETLVEIQNAYKLLYDKIFILQDEENEKEVICSYNIDLHETIDGDKIPRNTIGVHRKKQTNTLYTINALNYLITVLNDGKLDKQFPVPWQNYSNMVLVTNNGEFKKIKTRLLKIVELNG